MLENTLSTNFVPGTNLTGDPARASWRFLLPSLELDNILCLGIPATATLNVLSTMAKETVVISTKARQLETTQTVLEPQALSNVRTMHVNDFGCLPLPDKSVALVFFAGKKEALINWRDVSLAAELERLLKDGGAIYFEIKKLSDRIAAAPMLKRLANSGFAAPRVFWLGMPLWDLFYFMRTYGSWMSRVHGHKDPLQNFTQNFLEPSALHELLAATLQRYCAEVRLETDLIAPLFCTCWMHRSLKEATRLQKDAVQNGAFLNLLRRCIERRDSVALKSLLSSNEKLQYETKKEKPKVECVT